jgi:hypothetical protein
MIPGGGLTYTFSNGSSTVSPVANATYSITGTSAAGCVATTAAVATVVVNSLPVISVNSGSVCSGKTFTITASGASTYTYSGGSNLVSPLVNTNYSVTGTSAQGCPASTPAISSVVVVASPVVSVNSGTVCMGSPFIMNASGASTYTYSGGSATVVPAVSGSYSVTGTSAAGCVSSNTAVANVTVMQLPLITVNGGTAICSGASATLTASGGVTYSWTNGPTGNTYVVNPASTTTYSVAATGSNGCNNVVSHTLAVNPLPAITVNSGAICSGDNFVLLPGGANSYTYSSGSATVSPLVNTSYTVTGTSGAGCISSTGAISNVTVNPLPSLTITAPANACDGDLISLTGAGAASYTWNTGATGFSTSATPSTSTAFTLTGTSAEGCIGQATFTVNVQPLPTITVNSGAICPGNSFTLTPSGASTYTYSGGSNIVSPLVTASYTITGTSAQGCTSATAAIATVSVVNTLTVTITGNNTICEGDTVNLTGNGAGTYSWSTGVTANTIAVVPAISTSYSVTGISGTCTDVAVFTITVFPTPTIQVNSGAICSGDSFTINPSGANSYTYSGNTNVVSPVLTTTYSVMGADTMGCVSGAAISSVTVNPLPTVTISAARLVVCDGEPTELAGSGANSYSWNNGSAGSTINVTPSVTTGYTVTGTDQNNCSNSAFITIAVDPCTGIEDHNGKVSGFQIYPNPNTGNFNVKVYLNGSSKCELRIEDVQGKELNTYSLDANEVINVAAPLIPGIYFGKLMVDGNVVSSQKIIITQ